MACHCSAKDPNFRVIPVAAQWGCCNMAIGQFTQRNPLRFRLGRTSRASGHSKTCLFTSLLYPLALISDFGSRLTESGHVSQGITRDKRTWHCLLFIVPSAPGRRPHLLPWPRACHENFTRLTVNISNTLSPNLGPWICLPWQLWKDFEFHKVIYIYSHIVYLYIIQWNLCLVFVSWYDQLKSLDKGGCTALHSWARDSVQQLRVKSYAMLSWAKLCGEHQNRWCLWNLWMYVPIHILHMYICIYIYNCYLLLYKYTYVHI